MRYSLCVPERAPASGPLGARGIRSSAGAGTRPRAAGGGGGGGGSVVGAGDARRASPRPAEQRAARRCAAEPGSAAELRAGHREARPLAQGAGAGRGRPSPDDSGDPQTPSPPATQGGQPPRRAYERRDGRAGRDSRWRRRQPRWVGAARQRWCSSEPSGRRIGQKLLAPEPLFRLQVLIRCSSPERGRAVECLQGLLGCFDGFAGANSLRVVGVRFLGLAFAGSDLPGRRGWFDRRLRTGLFRPARKDYVTAGRWQGC